MRFILLCVAMAASLAASASSNPRVERILGPNRSCSLVEVYEIEVSDSDRLEVTIQGGTITPLGGTNQTSVCGGVTGTVNSTTSITYRGDDGNCEFIVSVRAVWNSSGTRRLTARAVNGSNSNTRTLTYLGTQVTLNGPSGPICLPPFGGGSEFFSSQGPAGASISWTASSFNNPPLSISSPTSRSTSISGFVPGGFYSIGVTYTCPGQTPRSSFVNVQALDFEDPQCGGFFLQDDGEGDADVPAVDATRETLDDSAETEVVPNGKQLPGTDPAGPSTLEFAGEVKLFPNPAPAGGVVQFRIAEGFFTGTDVATAIITDLNGRVVANRTISSYGGELSLAGLKAGMYVVSITNGKQAKRVQLIVGARP